jgi:hypothetical protein
MHCLEAEGCVICRGRNLVVDFAKIAPRDGHFSYQGQHKHFTYDPGAFGMSECDFNQQAVRGRGFAMLLDNMFKTWNHYDKPQKCDVVVEHPVIILVRFEAWNLWHQLGDWFCAFVTNLALGIDPSEADTQVLFFDSHASSALVDPYSLFSPRHEVKRALLDTDWAGKKVCFRDAIFPYEGYGAAFERNGYQVQTGDPCGPSDLLMSLSRWMLNQYNLIQEGPWEKGPAITLVVRKAGTGEKKDTDRHIGNQLELTKAIKQRIESTYSKYGEVKFTEIDLAELKFREQLQLVYSRTNILIGVHGAGLSHLIFLPPEAVVVELVPETHKQMIFFRNMAKQTNKVYLTVPMQRNIVDLDRFLMALDAAVAVTRSYGTKIAPYD